MYGMDNMFSQCIVTSPSAAQWSIVMTVSVCLSVCVFVCVRAYLRNYTSDLRQSLCMLPVAVARSSIWRRCDTTCTSGFMYDIIFAPSETYIQQPGTVYLTLYEALNPLTLSKGYLNPSYVQSHTLAFHSHLQHVIPLPCINLCNAP